MSLVNYELRGSSAVITLNRPEKRNSLSPGLVSEFKKIFVSCSADPAIKAIIITGAGTSFCAGADLAYLKQISVFDNNENYKDSDELSGLFYMIYKSDKLTIAAVNGPAIAGGCGLASCTDYIIAGKNTAKFGYSEVKIGFLPAIVSAFLIKRIGESKARRMLISGEIIDAQQAYDYGFADQLSDDPLQDAQLFAEKLSVNSSFSIGETKKLIREVGRLSIEQAVEYCVSLNAVSRRSDDFISGISTFLRKE